MEKLWTTTEVAQFLGIAEGAVEQLVRSGHLTGYKLGGQFLRFRPDQVEALKGRGAFQLPTDSSVVRHTNGWLAQVGDFFYFYDFYVVSASLLAFLLVYLIVSG